MQNHSAAMQNYSAAMQNYSVAVRNSKAAKLCSVGRVKQSLSMLHQAWNPSGIAVTHVAGCSVRYPTLKSNRSIAV
jgi:hypothetical protein